MDENGDAGGNYTVLRSKVIKSTSSGKKASFGLFPIGTFITRSKENGQNIPVRNDIKGKFEWKIFIQNEKTM